MVEIWEGLAQKPLATYIEIEITLSKLDSEELVQLQHNVARLLQDKLMTTEIGLEKIQRTE